MLVALALLLPVSAPPDAPQDAVRYARVSADSTRAHAHYDSKTTAVAELAKGVPLRVVEEVTPWVRVEVPAGLDVWIHRDYVEIDGVEGRPLGDRIRVRPLPSTGAESYPMGHYATSDRLLRLGASGDWVQVRAPERITAWVQSADLSIQGSEPEGWQADWTEWAKRRAARPVPAPRSSGDAPVVEPPQVDPNAEAEAEPGTPVPASGDTEAAPAEASAEPAPPLPDAAAIAADPAASMQRIASRLDVLYKRMVADREHWDRPLLDALEIAAGEVVWQTRDERTVEAGRAALRRIDVLRRAYLDALARQVRAAEARGDDEVAVLLRDRLKRASAPPPPAQSPSVVIGMVAWRPEPHSGRPYAVERLGFEAIVHCYDGRYALADYRDREVVLHGSWRVEGAGAQAQRVFAIEELRVLPRLGD